MDNARTTPGRLATLCPAMLILLLSGCGSSGSDEPQDEPGGDEAPDNDSAVASPGDVYPARIDLAVDRTLLDAAPGPAVELPVHSRVIGDVNGDGIDDIARVVREAADRYSAAVYFGRESGAYPELDELDGNNGFILENVDGDIEGDYWRGGFEDVGDLNGDGYADIGFANFSWVTSEYAPDGGYGNGWGFKVLPGGPAFDARRSALNIPSAQLLVELGTATGETGAGDIDGDGFDDLLIGTRWQAGRVLYGSADLNLVASLDELPGEVFCQGCRVRPVGDFDADGHADLLMQYHTTDCGFSDAIFLGYGNPDGFDVMTFSDEYADAALTRIVSDAGGPCSTADLYFSAYGDIDGDGASDFLLPHYEFDSNRASALFFGLPGRRPKAISYDELDGAKGLRIELGPEQDSDDYSPYGQPDLSITDVDGDGFDDIRFPGDDVFFGRARDIAAVDWPIVSRTAEAIDVRWDALAQPTATQLRLLVDGVSHAELSADVKEHVLADPAAGAAFELSLQTLDASGQVLTTAVRRVPAFDHRENLVGRVRGDRVLELTFNGDPNITYHSHYLVWRDGEPAGRSINGADNYVDTRVEPGTTYRYFITPDYLVDGSLDAGSMRVWPLLQRRSNEVELTTQGERPQDGPDIEPLPPGDNEGAAPSGIRLEIYSAELAELFWENAAGVITTEVYRDGTLLDVVTGTSFYDNTRQADVAHHYALIATLDDGSRSTISPLGNFEASSADVDRYPFDVDLSGNTAALVVMSDSGPEAQILLRDTWGSEASAGPDPWQSVTAFATQPDSLPSFMATAMALSGDVLVVGTVRETFVEVDGDTEFHYNAEFGIAERDAAGLWGAPRPLAFDDETDPLGDNPIEATVAADGTTVLVGGRNAAVYVFERDEFGNWQSTRKLAAADGQAIGDAVALHDDIAVVAAAGGTRLHVFARDASGGWTERQTLAGMAEPSWSGDLELAVTSDTIALGQERRDAPVILYSPDAEGTWQRAQEIAIKDTFVASLDVGGDTLLIGHPDLDGLTQYSGRTVVYRRVSSGDWQESLTLFAADGGRRFGHAVALDGANAVVLGERPESSGGDAAYFYALPAESVP